MQQHPGAPPQSVCLAQAVNVMSVFIKFILCVRSLKVHGPQNVTEHMSQSFLNNQTSVLTCTTYVLAEFVLLFNTHTCFSRPGLPSASSFVCKQGTCCDSHRGTECLCDQHCWPRCGSVNDTHGWQELPHQGQRQQAAGLHCHTHGSGAEAGALWERMHAPAGCTARRRHCSTARLRQQTCGKLWRSN